MSKKPGSSIETLDDTEKQETEYAHLTVEEQQLGAELESLTERRKNMISPNEGTICLVVNSLHGSEKTDPRIKFIT